MSSINLFKPTPMNGHAELFETLLKCRNVTIERIQSPAMTRSERLTQEQDEWVSLLQGEATLEMGGEIVDLHCGETLFIPGGTAHQVLRTSRDPLCIWLAVHIH